MNTKPELYIYTTKSVSKKSVATSDGEVFYVKLKLGYTTIGAEERIYQQDGTSNHEPLIPIFKKFVPSHITDIVWHNAMENEGYKKARVDKDREWFVFPDCDTAKEAKKIAVGVLNELIHGKRAIEDFEFDDYQIEFAEWTKQRFDDGANELLNGSKMRSGKCAMGHLTTNINNFQKVLIISGKPKVLTGWGELLIGGEKAHVKFADNHFFHYKNQKNEPIPFTSEKNTVAVGLQWIHSHTKAGGNKLLDQIVNTIWDAVYIDESHSAKDTKLAQEFLLQLKAEKIINFTGTPFKVFMTNEIAPEDRWAWDYIAEQKHRKWLLENDPESNQARRFKYLPKVNYAMMNVPEKVKKLLNGELFNLGANGLWAIDKDTENFVYPDAVNEMINFVKTQGYKNVPTVFKPYIDVHTRHSFWLLPNNTLAIKRLRDFLQRHPYFKKFQIIVASGNEMKDEAFVRNAIDRIEQDLSQYRGTITLSCGCFVEGATIPEWCSIHQLNSDKSAIDYFQSSFRPGSPWPAGNKMEIGVYDYDPERFIQMVYTLGVDYCDRKNNQSPSDWIETQWNEVSDVYDYDNKWKLISGKDIVKQATSDIAGQSNMFNDISLVDVKKITEDMITDLQGTEYTNTQSSSSTLNKNNLEKGSLKTSDKDGSSNPSQKTVDELLVTRLQISEAVKKIPNLIYISYDYGFEIKSIYDILNCTRQSLVHDHTGLTVVQWSSIIKTLTVEKIDRRIDAYVNA